MTDAAPSGVPPHGATVRPTIGPLPLEDSDMTVITAHAQGSVRPSVPPDSVAPPADAADAADAADVVDGAAAAPAAGPLLPEKRPVGAIAAGSLAIVVLGAVLFWPRPARPPASVPVAAAPVVAAPPAVVTPAAPSAPACPLVLADGTPACPAMVAVAGGSYRMGALPNDPNAAAEEFGAVNATIAPFEIGAREVSLQDWQLCVADGACKAPAGAASADGRLPVTGVSWDAVQVYLGWLSARTGTSYRLPTEAEWELAARGAGAAATFPWGDAIGQGNAHCGQCASPVPITGPAPVGSFKEYRGLHDMVGNVYEWVDDCWYGSHADAPSKPDAKERAACKKKVQKGGAFDSPEADVRPIARTWGNRGDADQRVGFRLAR
jgi:formylglycine-generating enzyme required for sulfatase activity